MTGIAAFLLVGESFAPWQYIGTVALLAGLLMVLFSSYMVRGVAYGVQLHTVLIYRIQRVIFVGKLTSTKT